MKNLLVVVVFVLLSPYFRRKWIPIGTAVATVSKTSKPIASPANSLRLRDSNDPLK